VENCNNTAIPAVETNEFKVTTDKNTITISGLANSSVSLYDLMGKRCFQAMIMSNEVIISNLKSGIYFVRLDNSNKSVKVLVR
jgi:hypothetical protein